MDEANIKTAQVVSSLPVVRLSEHSIGSPFNGVKEVLSPVAALAYRLTCVFFQMNMRYLSYHNGIMLIL